MRRFLKWCLGRFDEFMIFCTATWQRTMVSVLIYITVFVLCLAVFPLFRLIFMIIVSAGAAGLFLTATIGNLKRPPK